MNESIIGISLDAVRAELEYRRDQIAVSRPRRIRRIRRAAR
jgi:hypothetical protein